MNGFLLISKHRAELMFFAIIWVIWYHFTPQSSETLWQIIGRIGYGGVDIFMFLSGFGLANTYYGDKPLNVAKFYRKRLVKILPPYFICIIVFGIIRGAQLSDMIWQLSCVGFWLGKPYYDWYIPSALVLYAFFPFFIHYSKKYGKKRVAALCILSGLAVTSVFVLLWKGTWILFTSRVPIFIIGCIWGYYLSQRREWRLSKGVSLIVISTLVLIIEVILTRSFSFDFMLKSGLATLPFIFIVPGLCVCISYLLEYIPAKVLFPFKWLGAMTLEIYLCHMSLRFIYPGSKFLLPILCGFILHFLIYGFFPQFEKKACINIKPSRDK